MSHAQAQRNLRRYLGKEVKGMVDATIKQGGALEVGGKHMMLVTALGKRIPVPGTPRNKDSAKRMFKRDLEKAGVEL